MNHYIVGTKPTKGITNKVLKYNYFFDYILWLLKHKEVLKC